MYTKPPYIRGWKKGSDPRFVHGGVWIGIVRLARSTDRSGREPDDRCNYFSFRLPQEKFAKKREWSEHL